MKMLYTHKELEKLLSSDYQIKKAISSGKFFKIERGIYSSMQRVHPFEVIMKKYPNAVVTMDSAFYLYGFTDVIPDKTYLATKRDAARIVDKSIVQVLVLEKLFEIGKTQMDFESALISIYDKERMLIELVRNKQRMGFDYYKEIIGSYRKVIHKLDIRNIEDYAGMFNSENYIFKTIQEEVF